MAEDTHVKDLLYPRVAEALKKKENVDMLLNYIGKFIDRNNAIYFSLNFSQRLVVGDTDQDIIFTVTSITSKEAQAIISGSNYIARVSWVSNPFTVLMALAIRYFALNKMDKEAEVSTIFVASLYYTLTHVRSFPYLPNREIMDYTLNKNPKVTNSFIIKKEGTIFGLIKYTASTSHLFYSKELMGDCTDVELNNYLSAIRTRIGSNMKNLATYYYQDHKAGNFMNKDTESFEEENYHMTDSTSLSIAKLTTKTTTNLVSYRFNRGFIDRSAAMDINTSPYKLAHIMDTIIENHRQDLEKFISAIIELYVVEGQNNINEISSLKFLTHALSLYKTNSTRPKVIEIKDFLDKWIDDGTKKFGYQFVRAATVNAYRKCIFMTFVYSINREAK
jgi:hypothetical protein